MNMNNIYKFLALGCVALTAASCDLNLTPKGSITYTPGDKIIVNESDVNGFKANILSTMRSLDGGVFEIAPDLMVDYFNASNDYANNYGSIHRADNTFNSGDYDSEAQWETPFSAIKNFNIFIHGAQPDKVPGELVAAANVVRGYAYFGRAYAYQHMARIFGKAYSASAATDPCVPLVTVYDQSARPERASVKDVYAQIKSDLDSAAVLLAKEAGSARAQKPTIDAVNAMYARYYIDVKDYAKAAEYAVKVISTGKYSLSSTAEEMVAEFVNDNGQEPILQYYASKTEGTGAHGEYLRTGSDKTIGKYYAPYFIPSQKLIDAYEASDLRFAQWFDNETPGMFTGSFYNLDGAHDVYFFVKYYGNPELYTTTYNNSTQAKKPLTISEMYLIAAEANALNGDEAAAAKYLNELQTKRGATATSGSIQNVKNEWYKETVGEGLRMSCLKRWGEGFSGRPIQNGAEDLAVSGQYFDKKEMPADDYHFQWPVPHYEMQTNLNLTQNPGYSVN